MKNLNKFDMKHLLSIVLVISMVLVCSSFVLGAVTLNTPVTLTNYTTITFNCTKAVGDAPINATKVEIYYNATGGSTDTKLGQITNDTVDDVYFVSSISIEALSDALTYNFTCKAVNISGLSNASSAQVVSVGIDNTASTLTIDDYDVNTATAKIYSKDNVNLTWTNVDATSGVETTTVTLTVAPKWANYCSIGGTTSWSTATGSEILTGDQTECVGTYTATLEGTDDAGNTATSTTTTFTVDELGSYVPTATQPGQVTQYTTSTNKVADFFRGILAWIKGLFSKL